MKRNKWMLFLLAVLLLVSSPFVAAAEETEGEENVVSIDSLEAFLEFAENCRLDSYSKDLSVVLKTDLDLSDVDFTGIPIFCGSFDGDGHTIQGMNLSHEGSAVGLFRYLAAEAKVKNLTVSGNLVPQGSRAKVGGIAGSNAGTLQNCTFTGKISAGEYTGGLAGENKLTGVIENCSVQGQINGIHFVGGLTGRNMGVVRDCDNYASINVTVQQNKVEIGDITMKAITDSESVNTVTDIGGIAGSNDGVIRDCGNHGDLGYPKIGYNIGGIAGSQMGFITGCRNYAVVSGRKEIGGIVGQMEPVTNLEYAKDTLQILKGQLETMSALTDRAAANASEGMQEISGELQNLAYNVDYAWDAVVELMKDPEDMDSILAAQSVLNGALSSIEANLYDMTYSAYDAANAVSSDMSAITNQIKMMENTISNASDHLGGAIIDISDQDTEEDIVGKISDCINYGDISADSNAGGIVGAMALENDLDPESDITITGDQSLNASTELRAVVLNCKNSGQITAAKQNAGGIAGWVWLGLVKDCVNTGRLNAEQADYIGGIAGRSGGFIRRCYTKCEVLGNDYVGGICGFGDEVTDCRSMIKIHGSEWTGAILGDTDADFDQEEDKVDDNYYMVIGKDPGAIDGISYGGVAEPLTEEAFMKLSDIPEDFRSYQVYFRYENGGGKMIRVKVGDKLKKTDIPKLPEKEGHVGEWSGLNDDPIAFDTVIKAEYTPLTSVLQSETGAETEKPALIAEGQFTLEASLDVLDEACDWTGMKTPVSSCRFVVPESGTSCTVHYLIPEDFDGEKLQVMRLGSDGKWWEVISHVDGSYLVFDAEPGENQVVLLEEGPSAWVFAGSAVTAVLIVGFIAFWIKRKQKQA